MLQNKKLFSMIIGVPFFFVGVAYFAQNQKMNRITLSHDLIIFTKGGHTYINAKQNEVRPENDIEKLKIKKRIKDTIFLSSPENEIYELNLTNNAMKKIDVAQDKPVEYQSDLKREVLDIDQTMRYYLFKHDIIQVVDGKNQEVQTNLGSSERLYSIARFKNKLYVGTAVNGIKVATINNTGKLYFKSLNNGLPFIPFDKHLNFFEEIHSLHFMENGNLIAGLGIKGGVYIKEQKENSFKALPWPDSWPNTDVYQISSGKHDTLWVSCDQGLVIYNLENHNYTFKTYTWQDIPYPYTGFLIQDPADRDLYAYYQKPQIGLNDGKKARMEKAASKRLFYSSPYNFLYKSKTIDELLKSPNFDGIVMDIKDDHGKILYNSNISFLKEVGAYHPVINLNDFIHLVHQYKKYIAVRIVVFKDPVLFEFEDYAIWNKVENKPWIGNPKERWIDPYNTSLVEKYYAPLLKELEKMGVDEIQLDYIRFPAEGQLNECEFRHKKNKKNYTEAIEDFLYNIRKSTSLPISLDIYGYQGLYRTPGAIGQDMEVFGKYADVISPMLYSSHFGDLYLTDIKKEKRIFRLIQHSIRRAEFIANSKYLIRPYLQAFPMKSAIWGYGDWYFLDQIKASFEERGSGYSFWGSIENMKAVDLAQELVR